MPKSGRFTTLKHLDFYGKTLGFHFRGQDKLRSCTGATLSLIVFSAICITSAYRLLAYAAESHRTFLRHDIPDFFEGVGSSDDSNAFAPDGTMSEEQMEAYDIFYMGVGFATPPNFEYEERGFGDWRFFQHVKVVSETGAIVEQVTEVKMINCFAFMSDFLPTTASADRLIEGQDIRSKLKCVDKKELSRLQARAAEHWLSQPRYSF